jgi:hypothetical protein
VKFIILIIFTVLSSHLFGQKNGFDYNEEIFVKYAIVAMQEYYLESDVKSSFNENFDTMNYLTHGKTLKDCNGKKRKVVLVAFKSKTGSYHASVYMILNDDNFFDSIIDRGISLVTPESEIESFKKNADGQTLFQCGI